MLFVTNRKINETPHADSLPRSITFDQTGTDRGIVGMDLYFCKRTGKNKYQEIGSNAFFQRIQDSPNKHVMAMLHGFNVGPDAAIEDHYRFQKLCDKTGGAITVVSIVWPSWAGTAWYYDDQRQADMSAVGLSRFWSKLLRWAQANKFTKRIHNFAHSMGNRVNRESLLGVEKYEGLSLPSYLFDTSFMLAADVPNESLESHHPGVVVSKTSRNVVVYYAEDDNALEASRLLNTATGQTKGGYIDGRRLGESGPETFNKCASHVYIVDCDRVNEGREDDWGWFDAGHTYYLKDDSGRPSVVFEHITNTIRTGKPKAKANRTLKL